MQIPAQPANESERLQALHSLNILDTPRDDRFDRITRIAKFLFGVNVAAISLVDKERQWFKSIQGLNISEISRDVSFCGHSILQRDILTIENALEDERFKDNPLVTTDPRIRFYAGMPIASPDGHAIGTLCIIDDKPRQLNYDQIIVLKDLARLVEDELVALSSDRIRAELGLLSSQNKKSLALVLQREKLASIGQLAAGVAHEINNPLGFIGSNFSRIEEYTDELFKLLADLTGALREDSNLPAGIHARIDHLLAASDCEFLRADLKDIYKDTRDGLKRVRDIIQSLKDFSRDESKKDDHSLCNLNQVVESTLKLINNEVKYHCRIQTRLGDIPDVMMNYSQIGQVVTNLLINAAQAIDEAGRTDGLIEITTCLSDDGVKLCVKDNGPGISMENQGKIFDAFFTTKPVGKGTGLGLNISYDIVVNHHKGHLRFTTEPGNGTEFCMILPCHVS